MKILRTIISFILLAAGVLMFSLPVLRPACKRAVHAKSVATGKRPVPAGEMELPASCNAPDVTVELVAIECALPPEAIAIKQNYPLVKERFPADPFPQGIDAPPRNDAAM